MKPRNAGRRVAVIDVGSNSIKALVATRGPDGRLVTLAHRTLEARISAGLSRDQPRLGEAGVARGMAAITELLRATREAGAEATAMVATSAVRDAANGPEFQARVLAATGLPLRILTGEEEANLIGRGLTADPALADLQDFYVFDLGGGSLECLAFRARRIEQGVSRPLGCVRLTERFIPDPARPLAAAEAAALAHHVRTDLAGRFHASLPRHAAAVATGGTITTLRAMLAARRGADLEASPPRVTTAEARELLATAGALTLEARRTLPGLPASRADVFPAAVVTLLTVAELGGFDAFRHSFFNLRYGIADELLA